MGTETKKTEKTEKETLESGITLKEAKVHKLVIKGNKNYFELHKVNVKTNKFINRVFIDANSNLVDFKKACAKYAKDLD